MQLDSANEEEISVQNNYASLADLCRALSISTATGKNWVRLGKLLPSVMIGNSPFFTYEYIGKLKENIQSGVISVLKNRRNKKFVSGESRVYQSYLSRESDNIFVIQSIIDIIHDRNIEVTEPLLLALVADCAVWLILSKTNPMLSCGGLAAFLKGAYSDVSYMYLVEDLLSDDLLIKKYIESYPELFENHYVYEEGEDIIGLLYISLKNIAARKSAGAYYTPANIVKRLCSRLFSLNDFAGKTVLDPCCGTGNFILQLPACISYENVYGNDIDPISVAISRINYALKYSICDRNIIYSHITQSNYLLSENNIKYDFIIGNPPWGYDFSQKDKRIFKNKYFSVKGSNIESYDLFVEQSLKYLQEGGVLSFVLPEAFLNVKAHMPVRTLLLEVSSVQYIEYLGEVFDRVQCPSIILQLKYNNKPFCTSGTIVNDGIRDFIISSDRDCNAECLQFRITDEEYTLLRKLDSIENKTTLKNNSIFALGIVTGNNKKYISSEYTDGKEMILKGSDIYKFKFKKSNNYIKFNPEVFQQVAPIEYYRADEKLFYRFISEKLVFAYDGEKSLSLNSCNILIPKFNDLNIKYIMAILNSRLAQFYFNKKFNSVKVLRSHLEQIPIPHIPSSFQNSIVKIVDLILKADENNELLKMYDYLDRQISILYNLSEKEYLLIKASLDNRDLLLL